MTNYGKKSEASGVGAMLHTKWLTDTSHFSYAYRLRMFGLKTLELRRLQADLIK